MASEFSVEYDETDENYIHMRRAWKRSKYIWEDTPDKLFWMLKSWYVNSSPYVPTAMNHF